MDGSILDDVKAICGITAENTDFDSQLVIFINSAISTVWQLGSFDGDLKEITGKDSKWTDLCDDEDVKNLVKEYVCLKTRIIFDPPTSSTLESALNSKIDELEFRINLVAGLTSPEKKEVETYTASKLDHRKIEYEEEYRID